MARDLREETNFNAQEWALFKKGAESVGLTKATFLRFAALQVAEKYMREDAKKAAERISEFDR
jgi:hypothetical protein